jgi:hypothetical protein
MQTWRLLGVVELDHGEKRVLGHDRLHHSQERFALFFFGGGRLLLVKEAELLAAHS